MRVLVFLLVCAACATSSARTPGAPSSATEPASLLSDASGPAAWQVGLAPKEREALSTAQKDRFPTRYEQQLTLYYQNLAAGDSSK